MKTCIDCGHELETTEDACPKCGGPLFGEPEEVEDTEEEED